VTHPGYACLVSEVENPERYGIFELDEFENIKQVIEKPEKPIGNLANTG
jgi:dTDP-glucose pyrophosphorylase